MTKMYHAQINIFLFRNRVQNGNKANLPTSALLRAGRERWALSTSPSRSWDTDLGIHFCFSDQRAKNCFVAGLYLNLAFLANTKETPCPRVPTPVNQRWHQL